MDYEKFAELREDYMRRKFPDGLPASKGREDMARAFGRAVLSMEDEREIAHGVYKELLESEVGKASWSIQVKIDGTFYASHATKEWLAFKGYDCCLCVEIGGVLRAVK